MTTTVIIEEVPTTTEYDLPIESNDPLLEPEPRRANMAVYASGATDADKSIPRRLGEQLGLIRLDRNWLADDDGISPIRVAAERAAARGDYIPYTDRPIRWHTDGYYNDASRRIRGMILHCVRRPAAGGENTLLDHEIAYLRLRDEDPAHLRALMLRDALTIPERADDEGVARPAPPGPVFSVDPHSGHLHMRYTARTRSIAWSPDPATTEVNATDTTIDAVVGTPFLVQWDLRDWADIQMYINGVNVLPSSVFKLKPPLAP